MGMSGNLQTVPLVDLLQWITSDNRTGCLILSKGDDERRVFFKKGKVVSFSSADERDRFGQFLIHSGSLTPVALARILEEQKEHNKALGRALLDAGILDEKELIRKLRSHAMELCTALFLWDEGSFEFVTEEVDERDFVPFVISPDEILLEGHRRIDEWKRIRSRLATDDLVPRLDPEKALKALSELDPNTIEYMLLEFIDGRRSIIELYDGIPASKFRLFEALYNLLTDGVVSVSDKPVVKDITGEFMMPDRVSDEDMVEEEVASGKAEEEVEEEEIEKESEATPEKTEEIPAPEPAAPEPPPPPTPSPPKEVPAKKPAKASPAPSDKKGGGLPVGLIAGIVVVVLVIVAAVFYLKGGGKKEEPPTPTKTAAPSPTKTATPSPTATPAPSPSPSAAPTPDPATMMADAKGLFDKGQLVEARKAAEAILDADAGNADAKGLIEKIDAKEASGKAGGLIKKARAAERAGDLPGAIRLYEQAIAADPKNRSAKSYLAAAKKRQETEKSLAPLLADLQRAIDRGDSKAAEPLLAKARSLSPRDSRVKSAAKKLAKLREKETAKANAEKLKKLVADGRKALAAGNLAAADVAAAKAAALDAGNASVADLRKAIAKAKAKPKGTVTVGTPLLTGVGYKQITFKKKILPAFPEKALAKKQSGKVMVSVNIAPDGTVKSAHLMKQASPETGFNEAALAAARKWVFNPPEKMDGSPAEVSHWGVVVKFRP